MSVSGQRSDTDKAITQKLLSHVHSLPVYGQEEAWEQIEARVFQKKPTRYRPSPQMLVASAVVIAILVVFAYSPTGNAWVTRHLGVYISTVSESVRNLVLHEVPSSAHQRMVVPLLSKIDFQPLITCKNRVAVTISWFLLMWMRKTARTRYRNQALIRIAVRVGSMTLMTQPLPRTLFVEQQFIFCVSKMVVGGQPGASPTSP